MIDVVGRIVGVVMVLAVTGPLVVGQNVRGPLGPRSFGNLLPPVPMYELAVVDAARAWAAEPAAEALQDELLRVVHAALGAAFPVVAEAGYAVGQQCMYLAGTGGTSKLDGGGGALEALNPKEFEPMRDVVAIADVAGLASPIPGRLVIVDEFDFTAIVTAWESNEPLDRLFLTSGKVKDTQSGWEVRHGHMVAHHVAMLLSHGANSLTSIGFESVAEHEVVRMTYDGFVVDLYAVNYGRVGGVFEALRAVARSVGEAGPSSVVLSWGLTDCALRDAYALAATRPEGLKVVTSYEHLADFAFAVLATVDEVATDRGAESVTETICRAADAHSGFDISGATAIGCADLDVRALVGTTVLFAAQERIADEAFGQVSDGLVFAPEHKYFASAGNERLPYPMPPGSLPEVLAVAACKPSGPDRAPFSNAGDRVFVEDASEEAIALGAWFAAPLADGDPQGVGYWGSSFAAPLAALASGAPRLAGQAQPPTFAHLCAPARWSEGQP